MMLYRGANIFCISCTFSFTIGVYQLNKMRKFCFFPITKHFCPFSINNKKPQHTTENVPLLFCTDICNNFFHLQSRIASGTLRTQLINALSCALNSYRLGCFFSVQFNVQICIHSLAPGNVIAGSSKGCHGPEKTVLREYIKKQTYLCLSIRWKFCIGRVSSYGRWRILQELFTKHFSWVRPIFSIYTYIL